ncbi:tetratricopeptide repeat protein [Streptomyces sp. NPDC050538]|uniref:tetratricopeptide repeat protein n=1 Tax=Streptomyces sp. NPDC050538 TaxID=3365627 RepID=UPI00378A2FEB
MSPFGEKVNASDDAIAAGRDIGFVVRGNNNQIHVAPQPAELMAGATAPVVPGRPIAECHPLDLEVHHAIETGTTSSSVLPVYVPRPHDLRLQTLVEEVLAGHSRMAVLVGGSSTGKTRACWEAVRPLAAQPEWRLWHPYNPGRAEAALEGLRHVGPHTVVWLNETQHYLAPAHIGEQVAAEVRALLSDPARGPILLLGTLWPRYWDDLTALPDEGAEDPHAQARELLARCDLRVAESFTEAQLMAARAAIGTDERLSLALDQATDGRITQFLAGAPKLVKRYENAPAPARAVLDAAIDALRRGCGVHVPMGLLEAAAPGYLDEDEFYALGDDWLEQALAYAARPVHGGTAALRRVRHHPGRPRTADGPLYRLADYLLQYAQESGQPKRCEPPELWDSLVTHTRDPKDLLEIEKETRDRGMLRHAAIALLRAAEGEDGEAVGRLIRTLINDIERYDLAEPYLRRAAEMASREVWWTLAKHGNPEQRISACRRIVESSNRSTMTDLAPMLHGMGLVDPAIEWLTPGAERGDTDALGSLSFLLQSADRMRDAIQLLTPHAEGNAEIGTMLAYLLEDAGENDEAMRLLQALATSGEWYISTYYARLLAEDGRNEDAIEVLFHSFQRDGSGAYRELADLLEHNGRIDEAYDVLVQAVRLNYGKGLQRLEAISERHECLEKFASTLTDLIDNESINPYRMVSARFTLAETLVRIGRHSEAAAIYEELNRNGNRYAGIRLSDMYANLGFIEEAIAVWSTEAESGTAEAQYRLFAILNQAGHTQDALKWLQRSAKQGFHLAVQTWLAALSQYTNEDKDLLLSLALDKQEAALRHIANEPRCADILRRVAPHIGHMKGPIPWRALQDAGLTDEVRAWAWNQVRLSSFNAFRELLNVLETQGCHADASRLARYGLNSSGDPAPAWTWDEILHTATGLVPRPSTTDA